MNINFRGMQICPERHDVEEGYIVEDIYNASSFSDLVNNGQPSFFNPPDGYEDGNWGVAYTFKPGQRCLISVFPTRAFPYTDWKASQASFIYDLSIQADRTTTPLSVDYDEPPFPDDDDLDIMKAFGDIIVIWNELLWKNNTSYSGSQGGIYYFHDVQEYTVRPGLVSGLIDFITRAHAKELKVVPYTSLFYHSLAFNNNTQWLSEIQGLKTDYDFDGVYIDGLLLDYPGYPNSELESKITCRNIMSSLHSIFGKDVVVYLHNTNLAQIFQDNDSDNIHSTTNVSELSYTTVNFKAEGVEVDLFTDEYMLYHLNQYGISNSYGSPLKGGFSMPDDEIGEWVADKYGVVRRSWNYRTEEPRYWQLSADTTFTGAYLTEVESIEDPNPVNNHQKLSSTTPLSISSSDEYTDIEISLSDAEEATLSVDGVGYIIQRQGNTLTWDYGGVNQESIGTDLDVGKIWAVEGDSSDIFFTFNGLGSYLYRVSTITTTNPLGDWYKTITDLINDEQLRGLDIVSFVDNMVTNLNNSEILFEDIYRQRLEAQIISTANNLSGRNVSYTPQLVKFVTDLQKFMTNKYGSVDIYLSDNKIKVKSTFAEISEAVGYPILPTNVSDVS